jgi:soluble lytic murein transglycosylase
VIFFAIIFALDNAALLFYPVKYKSLVLQYSEKFNLDPYLVIAIIKVESNFKPEAVSPKNARGLMQISEKTGKWGANKLQLNNYVNDNLFNPETNIYIGCWYLSVLYGEFHDMDLVLAAYNGGSGNVTQWLNDTELSSNGKSLDRIPFKETEHYLKKVKNSYIIYKKLYENEF